MSTELERHKAAVKAVITGLRSLGLDYAHLAHAIEERINEALHPKPEMEEVEVVRWEHAETHYFTDKEPNPGNENWVKLTGTLKRPKPQPVERTAQVKFHATPAITYIQVSGDSLPNAEFVGTLTWTEDPK